MSSINTDYNLRYRNDYFPNNNVSYDQINHMSEKLNNNLNLNNIQMNNKVIPRNEERCDGCFDGEGHIFCVNCEKIYCKDCEDQIHIVPVNRLHER